MKYLMLILLLCQGVLCAITITDSNGQTQEVSRDELAALPRLTFETVREKDGETRRETWQGIRFDTWLESRVKTPFKVIRFESDDRYMVNLSKAEWDSLECWLAFAQGGKEFAGGSMRIIFPALRDMKWVRDIQRIVLEDLDAMGLPKRFEFLDTRLQSIEIKDNPAPFVNTKGYYFKDLLPLSARDSSCNVILYSRDGMKMGLEYPQHLEGAILEVTDDGFNLKSPSIPGGMWLKNIIFIQMNDLALIDIENIDALIALNRVLDWQLSPDVMFVVEQGGTTRKYPLVEILSEPELLKDVTTFSLTP